MAGTKTNSNSMTAILVVALNNKRSSFRNEFLKLIDLKEDNLIFYDGTHTSIEYQEINGKEVDVVGRIDGKTSFLMEIKVGIYESLQASQAKHGEYERVLKEHSDRVKKLVYLIPTGYIHEESLPESAEIIYWEEVLSIAKEFDNSGLENYIKEFVELSLWEETNLLSKGEYFMLVNQKAFVNAFSLSKKILRLNQRYLEYKKYYFKGNQDNLSGIGTYFSMSEKEAGNFYIGLNPQIPNSKYFFSIAIYKDQQIDTSISKLNSYTDGEGYTYFSFEEDENYQEFCLSEVEGEQQELYNKMIDNILSKLNLL